MGVFILNNACVTSHEMNRNALGEFHNHKSVLFQSINNNICCLLC